MELSDKSACMIAVQGVSQISRAEVFEDGIANAVVAKVANSVANFQGRLGQIRIDFSLFSEAQKLFSCGKRHIAGKSGWSVTLPRRWLTIWNMNLPLISLTPRRNLPLLRTLAALYLGVSFRPLSLCLRLLPNHLRSNLDH